jgi:adenosylmethionine-8-amino-7-oxononanoate aminotransferase
MALSSHVLHRSLRAEVPHAVRGRGIMLFRADGKEIIDASGGAAVACIGHGNPRVAAAIARQAEELAYVHSGFFTTEPTEELARLILERESGDLTRALFVSSGSEAMEASMKLGRQYFVERGEDKRVHFIGRRQGYHGATLAALAVGGHVARRATYLPLLDGAVSHVSPCFAYHGKLPGESDEAYVHRLAEELDAEFQRVGPDRVIAFCAETIVGATTGCVAAVPGYFPAIRTVCDRYGALLILDEIMSGMGRTGTRHAWQQENVTPDIQAVGKGLGGGYQPIGAVLVSSRVVNVLDGGSGGFSHGQTYQAHPVACAGALEVQRIIRDDNLLANVQRAGAHLEAGLRQTLGSHPNVGDIRGRGLFWALEFVQDRVRRSPFAAAEGIAEEVRCAALELGLAVYPGTGTVDGHNGDHILLAPPFNVTAAEIDQILDRLHTAVVRTFTR